MNFHKRINGWASRRRKRRAAARVGVANTFFLSVRRPNISHYFLRAVHLECCCGGGARGLIQRRFSLCSRRQIWVAAAPRWRSINSSARRNERAVWWRSPSLSTAPSSGGGSKNYTYAGEMTSWSIGQMTIKKSPARSLSLSLLLFIALSSGHFDACVHRHHLSWAAARKWHEDGSCPFLYPQMLMTVCV